LIREILYICIGYIIGVRNLSTVILLLYIMSFSPRFQSSVSTSRQAKMSISTDFCNYARCNSMYLCYQVTYLAIKWLTPSIRYWNSLSYEHKIHRSASNCFIYVFKRYFTLSRILSMQQIKIHISVKFHF